MARNSGESVIIPAVKRILITGIAGFIGFHVAQALQKRGDHVLGLDAFISYPEIKQARAHLLQAAGVDVKRLYISDRRAVADLLDRYSITHIIHLAAQPGVRQSLVDPSGCFQHNMEAFFTILELCRVRPSIKLVYASSSSVYGEGVHACKESEVSDRPLSLYAALKRGGELIAATYHHLYQFPVIGLRFFTVYGPWGRPDMAYFSFAQQIDERRAITLYDGGHLQRDFTYIDDIVSGVLAAVDRDILYGLYNLGKGETDSVLDLVRYLEEGLGKKAEICLQPKPATDVSSTWADISKSRQELGYHPTVSLQQGIHSFLEWYLQRCCVI